MTVWTEYGDIILFLVGGLSLVGIIFYLLYKHSLDFK